jgi:ribosomal protein L11 methylase PrmA
VLVGTLRAWRSRRYQRQLWRQWGVDRLNREYVERQGTVVKAGPFKGLVYPAESTTSVDALIPKLLGVYERQLQPWISKDWEIFANIGSAEGYYAVGMAMRGARVVAVDIDPWARTSCRRLARLNRVEDRVEVRGNLGPVPAEGLVLSDCEGAELEIFSPELVSHLSTSHVLMELHDFISDVPIKETMLNRFAASHRVTVISDARLREHPALSYLDADAQDLVLSEHRPPQEWLWFEPRE